MAVLETERHGQVLVVRMNRPERLNALNHELRVALAQTWTEFRHDTGLEVAILTGTGRAFCAGEDMKETLANNTPGGRRLEIEDPFATGALEKPVIAAVNGFAMGGGFMLVERTDLRVAARGAVFEVSEAKRWLLGGYDHGHLANLPYPIAMEMALGFRFTAERFHQLGFINRIVEPDRVITFKVPWVDDEGNVKVNLRFSRPWASKFCLGEFRPPSRKVWDPFLLIMG